MRRRRPPSSLVPALATQPLEILRTLEQLPERNAIICLCGPIGAGKSTLAREHWPESHVDVSVIRVEFGSLDDPTNIPATFKAAYQEVEQRLARGELVVFDSTAVTPRVRASIQRIAERFRVPCHLVVVDTPLTLARTRNRARPVPVPQT